MTRNQKRMLLSFILSLAGVVLTHYWYESGAGISLDYGDKKPMAQIAEAINEVQRKPLKRLIWQTLSQNENLYAGESVRTNEASQARILIPDTGTIIDLEPGSLVVLEDNNGELGLEFLKGNLFVKAGEGEKLKLKTGDSKISIAGAELSLGKSSGEQVDLQVFKGKADIEGQSVKNINDPFKIKSPMPGVDVHVLPDGKEPIEFEWQKLEKSYNVVLEVGKTRQELKATPNTKLVGDKIITNLPPGSYYWRLVTQESGKQEAPLVSAVYRLRVLPKRPPVALLPEKEQNIFTMDQQPKVLFKWANPGRLSDIVVELAESENLRQAPQTLRVKDSDVLEANLSKSGTYYWRVTGYIGAKKEPVSSPIQKFTVKIGENLQAPVLEVPSKGDKISFQTLKEKGVFFQWKPAPGAAQYKVILRAKDARGVASAEPLREEIVPVQQVRFNDLKPGQYEWVVTAISETKKESKPSEVWGFSVDEMPIMNWRDNSLQATYFYWSEKPEVFSDWLPGPKGTVSYRVKVRGESDPAEKSQSLTVANTQFKVSVESDSRYIASVEALSKEGTVIARTSDRVIEVKSAPLLEAPIYDESLPNPLKSSRSGVAEVSWKSIEGAQGYIIELSDSSGAVVKEEKVSSTKASMRKLMPGEYKVKIKAVDKAGRRGLASTERPLLVPDLSDAKAPKLMKIKVE